MIKDKLTPEEVIKRLKNNGFIKTPSGATIRMIDGVIVRCFKDGRYTINASVGNSEVDHEDGETFFIEKTGLYKTRDGRLAFVGFTDLIDYVRGYIEGDQYYTEWHKNGHYCGDCDGYDLVEYLGD